MITEQLEAGIAEVQPARRSGGVWRWQAVVIGALVILTYYGVVAKLVMDWYGNPDFSHGFLVPLFAGYVLWRGRERTLAIAARPTWWGLVVVAAGLGLLVAGSLGAELFLSRVSLVVLLAGLAITFWGTARFRAMIFPWAILFLMIPIPAIIFNQITFPLQLLASKLASSLLPVFGVPVLREGNVINLPSMPLEVAEACSGIRSLISLGTMAIIYGYFLDKSVWRRSVLAVAAIPIAVAANAIRIVGTGLCVQYWDPEQALGFFHEFSGWVMFVVSLFLLYLLHAAMTLVAKRTEAKA